MSTTVHVQGIAPETSDKEVHDFFSFCGKITNLTLTPSSAAPDAFKSASVSFEKETAAKTALLLDNTQLGKSQVRVSSAGSIDDLASKAGAAVHSSVPEDHIAQEDKPRSRIVAEYLAHGYALSDQVLQQAITLDTKHGYSSRFTQALQNFDTRYKATDRAKAMDAKYGATERAMSAWGGLNTYFEKALNTPTGQKVRDFYVQGDKQVRDIHNEARRLADLKAGKVHEPEPVAPGADKTVCSCGGAEGVCGCVPGKCQCVNCGKADVVENQPQPVKGTDKTVCNCGGSSAGCPCAPGHCACSNCAKSSDAAVVEAKEAAQASGQQLPS